MSEIESLGRMRCELQICKNAHRRPTIAFMEDCADEIEAEIAERFIALPVDVEGDVLRIGDELKCQGESILLNSLSWNGRRWYVTETVVSSGWYPVHLCRHVKPRTLEDVLEEFADAASDVDERDREEWVPLLAKYADEIREMKAK